MIPVSSELASIIRAGGFHREYVADLIVDGQRVLEDVPLGSCELKSDGNAKVRTQGRAVFEYTDAWGASILPEDVTSWLTPYASYLNVSMRVTAGGVSEKVLRGVLKIVAVSDPVGPRTGFQQRLITVGSRVSLQLADAFSTTDRERFIAPSGPQDLSSTWAEIGRLTGLPLLRNVPDSGITRAVTYQENRLDAVFDLAAILGGTPYVNPEGKVTIQPDVSGDATEKLSMGPDGTVTSATPSDLTDEGIYNQVVVRTHDDSQSVVLATAEVESGPLRYGGPFGRVPFFASSQYVTSVEQARQYAVEQLARVSAVSSMAYSITCLPDPRREVGDVVPFEVDGRTLVGRIQEITLAAAGLMSLKVATGG